MSLSARLRYKRRAAVAQRVPREGASVHVSRWAWVVLLMACDRNAVPSAAKPEVALAAAAPESETAPQKAQKEAAEDEADDLALMMQDADDAPAVLAPSATRRANELTLRMLQSLAGARKNVAVSSVALSVGLYALQQGARAASASELAEALKLDAHDVANLVDALDALTKDPGSGLRVGSSLYLPAGLKVERAFEDQLRAVGPIATRAALPFADDLEGARRKLLQDLGTKTQGKLESWPALAADSRAVLTSTLSLSARWATPFEASATRLEAFTRRDQQVVQVAVMAREGEFALGVLGDDATVIELPYAGERLVLDVVLPSPDEDMPRELYDADALGRALERLAPARARLLLPRFQVDEAPSRLKPVLEGLGIRRVFSAEEADLRGIAQASSRLALSEVLQGVSLVVHERGTQPSSARTPRTAPRAPSEAPTVAVNRPFAFLLREPASDLILLAGWIEDPSP